jgi:hypothetical protein
LEMIMGFEEKAEDEEGSRGEEDFEA